jgi:conjugative relaxase-like TrwC/TraI family protein
MLTIAKVASSAQAASYYEQADDYYSQDAAPSQWAGRGADALKLSGEVDAETFRELLDGKLPDGPAIQNAASGRRGGTDFTFSAPKSVSMQAFIGGDARLITAHETAVARALGYVEQNLAAYRETIGGETTRALSDNLLVAQFRHELSREADPQLHSHAVVINATQRPDGEWRALEQTDFYRQQKLLGALYRNELALEVQKLGYSVKLTHQDGRFEMAHVSREQTQAFSTRSAQIEAALLKAGKTRDTSSAKQKEHFALETRQAKGEIDRATLHASWCDKAKSLACDFRPALTASAPSAHLRDAAALAAMRYAVEHTIERDAVVNEHRLIQHALENGTGRTDLQSIQIALVTLTEKGELLKEGERYTTPGAQQHERDILALETRGRDVVTPIARVDSAGYHLAGTRLNEAQREAALFIVTTTDRVTGLHGVAGAGKTTMLTQAKHIAQTNGFTVHGLAPSASAARELANAGIKAETLAAFANHQHSPLTEKSLVILDEAGMVSAKDMHQVLSAIEAANARIVLVGDVQQLKAVEAGRPFHQLIDAGMAHATLGTIQRQRDANLKTAVELAVKSEVGKSLAKLDKHVIEIEAAGERYQAIAKDYAALPIAERTQTLILAGTHRAREAINTHVRENLGLVNKGVMVTALTRRDLTDIEARSILSYQPGDVIQAQKTYTSLGMQRGDLARVVEVTSSTVALQRADGAHVDWSPALHTNMTAYQPRELELAAGDEVRITANDHARELVNGELATVKAIDTERGSLALEKQNGALAHFDTDKPLHLDHGYCLTVHAAQGQTCERVLVEADTKSLTANESSYYVSISRARESATIYTDDREMLPESLSRADEKSAALDVKPEREMTVLER